MEKNKLNEKEVFLEVLSKIAAKVTPTAELTEKTKQTESLISEEDIQNFIKNKKISNNDSNKNNHSNNI